MKEEFVDIPSDRESIDDLCDFDDKAVSNYEIKKKLII